LPETQRHAFRLLHVSTDEVYGALSPEQPPFAETKAYEPNSPYSASKAASDHLVRAWHHTYGLPVLTTNCSNNYGPYQFPEKLLPLAISNASENRPIPVYGDGLQMRDWIHVSDNARALEAVLECGRAGETYHIGGGSPRTNLDLLRLLLKIMERPESLLTSVTDRLGHDRRYAVDFSKITNELGWKPEIPFEEGLAATVAWYRDNADWVARCRSGAYRSYYEEMYGKREAGALRL